MAFSWWMIFLVYDTTGTSQNNIHAVNHILEIVVPDGVDQQRSLCLGPMFTEWIDTYLFQTRMKYQSDLLQADSYRSGNNLWALWHHITSMGIAKTLCSLCLGCPSVNAPAIDNNVCVKLEISQLSLIDNACTRIRYHINHISCF